MASLFGKKRRKSQKAYEEGYGDQAQPTRHKPLTQEMDTLQPTLASVIDNDGQQSASQSARWSTGSVDSGVGGSSSCNNSIQLSHAEELASSTAQCIPLHERGNTTTHVPSTGTDASHVEGLVMEMAIKINKSFLEFGTSLGKNVKELTDRVGKLEVQIQKLQSKASSLKESSVEASESTPNQPSCTPPCCDSPETEQTPGMPTVSTQSELYSRTAAKDRLYSDGKMTRDRKFEIKRKQLESAKKRPVSEIVHTISEDNLEAPGYHSSSQPRKQDVDQPKSSGRSSIEDELRSRVNKKLPTFIRQTNWTFLLPHFMSVGLSDSATNDYLLNEHKSHQEKGVHFYLRVLPSKGPDAYTRFHRCLCDEKEHLGHQSLQTLLEIGDK